MPGPVRYVAPPPRPGAAARDGTSRKNNTLAVRWAIRLEVEGDLRFLSHHDMMRAVERTARRARLPLRYTQGFNPHPVMSLPHPRPVGVASRDDLLVLELETDAPPPPAEAGDLPARLNAAAPRGMRFLDARTLAGRGTPQPAAARYELPLEPQQLPLVRRRLEELASLETWTVPRRVSARGRRGGWSTRPIDLRPLVGELRLDGQTLRMTLRPQGDLWARPGEVLALLGLDERIDLARAVRAAVEYEP